jgi:hypothetical protein
MNYVTQQQVADKSRLYRKHRYIVNVHMLMFCKLSVKNYTRSPVITQKTVLTTITVLLHVTRRNQIGTNVSEEPAASFFRV